MRIMMQLLNYKTAFILMGFTLSTLFTVSANAEDLLPADKAFQFSVESQGDEHAVLKWDIQPNYYLYQHRFAVKDQAQALKLKLPQGKAQFDENFGHSQVYWNSVQFSIKTEPNQKYTVSWQGCAKDQLCYAPQRTEFSTNEYGQVIQNNGKFSLKSASANKSSVFMTDKTSSLDNKNAKTENVSELANPATGKKTTEQNAQTLSNKDKNIAVDTTSNMEQNAVQKNNVDKASQTKTSEQTSAKTESLKTTNQADKTSNDDIQQSNQQQNDKKTADGLVIAKNQSGDVSADKNTNVKNDAVENSKTSPQANLSAEQNTVTTTGSALITLAIEKTSQSLDGENHQQNNITADDEQNITVQSSDMEKNIAKNTASDEVLAEDQHWLQQLQQHSFGYAILLFLGLGFLLAFTPCSLPMIPIVSSLLVRQTQGAKAWMIALVFVLSMASVYAVMGFIASSAGLGLQRWLQQPATLIAFSLLFIVFALNLFGLFEIQLPRKMTQRLDQWQSVQKGGTFVGASMMGMLSALLVGPCMTAPLAGVLLFISQSEHQWQGAVLLFSLGFGMGIPLLLVSILGAKVLPKAGMWMNQVKVIFAFMMLALSIYFIRPLLIAELYQFLWYALGLSVVAYILYRFMWRDKIFKVIYTLLCVGSLAFVASCHYQQYKAQSVQTSSTQVIWQKATTAEQFKQMLANAPKHQAIIVDVYADWCVACQPIEKMLKEPDVQQALAVYTLIKLDLSEFDDSHQALLNEWEILGPPTILFLNAQQQEQRQLRFTGAFKKQEFLDRLQKLQ